MGNYFDLFIAFAVSLILALIIMPVFRGLAIRFGLVDKPNFRKLHVTPVPLVGGAVVFLSSVLALLIVPGIFENFSRLFPLLIGGTILLLVGVVDDRIDVRAIYKLCIQLGLAYYVFASGIRIESMYGVFGIYDIPEYLQFFLTVVVIAGTVNAFNLTDGIDGLAAGLAICGFLAFSVIAMVLGEWFLMTYFLAITGALISFLRYNLSKQKKVFMGDAGSLVLGYILVVSAIMLLQQAQVAGYMGYTLATVLGILALPVIDALRVFRRRIKTGYSPFRADKTHLHHLILTFGVNHKIASAIIVAIALLILVIALVSGSFFSITLSVILILFAFGLISGISQLNNQMSIWRKKVEKLEQQK